MEDRAGLTAAAAANGRCSPRFMALITSLPGVELIMEAAGTVFFPLSCTQASNEELIF